MKFLILTLVTLAAACASASTEAPEPVAAAQTTTVTPTATPATSLSIYEGTYALQAPTRVIELRAYVDDAGNLNGELVGMGQSTTFRTTDTPHKFLHGNADDIWVVFKVENGRATGATMHQRGREISGQRTK